MASSPIQSILKVEDLTSEEDACKSIKDASFSEILTYEDADEPMSSKHSTMVEDTPSTSCNYEHLGSQTKTSTEDTPDNRDLKNYVKTKPSQFETMVTFMIAHPDISKGATKDTVSRTKYNVLWNKLSDILNKNGPPRRSAEGWKKVWCDHKTYIRNKLRKNKICYLEPRGLPKKIYPLSRLEKRVATLLGFIPNDAAGDVTSTLSSEITDTQVPSTVNSSTVDIPAHQSADQSDNRNKEHNFDDSIESSNRYSPPLSRKCKKELLKIQIENQKEYTNNSKKILLEINNNLKGILKYSIKTFELKQKQFDLEKEKFIFKQKIQAEKHQIDLEKLQLQRDILRLKQETAGLIN